MGLLRTIGLSDLEARPPRERATFFFLVLMSTFLFMDQNLMAPNLTAIGEELLITRAEAELQLLAEDESFRRLDAEWEAQRPLVAEMKARVQAVSAELVARNPALGGGDRAALDRAVLEAMREQMGPDRVEAMVAAARLKEQRDARALAAFQAPVDDQLAGRAALYFWLLGGAMAVLAGYLADKVPRKRLLFVTIVVGAVPCLCTAFARSADQFVLLRALTGIGIGAVLPLTYSLLGDLFSARGRPVAAAWVGLAMGVGIAGGQVFAGIAGPTAGWRMPFIAVAVPNLVLAVIFLLVTREPRRGSAETELQSAMEHGAEYEERIKLGDLKKILSNRTNQLVFFQGIVGSIPWGIFFTYLVDYYHANKGYSVESATLLVTLFGAGAILGGFFGGLLGGRLYRQRTSRLPALCGAAVLAGIAPILLIINWTGAEVDLGWAMAKLAVLEGPGPSIAVPAVVGFIGAVVAAMPSSNVKAVLMNVNLPENRGTILGVFNLADDLGKGLAPFVLGSVLAVALGRTMAYNIAVLTWLVCGAAWIVLIKVFPRDVERLETTLRERGVALEAARASTTGASAAA
jgi:MFS family permease